MADTLHVDLVSPERRLASVEARALRIPGAEGDLTAMPDHAPMLTTLRPGVLRIDAGGDTTAFVVTGGFVDISGPAATVLAERAMPVEEVTDTFLDKLASDAAERRDAAGESGPDAAAAAKRIADVETLRDEVRQAGGATSG